MEINTLNECYKSEEGDRLAKEELLPVVQQYLYPVQSQVNMLMDNINFYFLTLL